MWGSAAVCLVSVITIWAGAAHIIGEDYRRTRETALHDTANLARAFDEHVIQSLQALDQTLLIARDAYLQNGLRFDLPRWVIESKFRTDVAFNISIVDRSGKVIATKITSDPVHVDDREYFRFHANSRTDTLHVSKPTDRPCDGPARPVPEPPHRRRDGPFRRRHRPDDRPGLLHVILPVGRYRPARNRATGRHRRHGAGTRRGDRPSRRPVVGRQHVVCSPGKRMGSVRSPESTRPMASRASPATGPFRSIRSSSSSASPSTRCSPTRSATAMSRSRARAFSAS